MVRFYLDNVEVDNPLNWEDIELTYRLDNDIRFFVRELSNTFDFVGSGYDALYTAFQSGWCNDVDVRIDYDCNNDGLYETIYNGKIFVSEVSFDTWQCIASVQVADNSVNALIRESRNQKYFLNVGESKNGVDITSYVVSTDIYFHTVTDDTTDVDPTTCYRVEDAFRFLLKALSDDTLEFTSDLFGVGGKWEGLCVVTGTEIYNRQGSTAPNISFDELFTEVNKKQPIIGIVEQSNGVVTIRIEDENYFYRDQSNTVEYSTVKNIELSVDQSRLYSVMNIGSVGFRESNDVPSGGTLTSDGGVRWIGHKQEEYNFKGVCNISTELELVSEWKIDNNSIENLRLNGGLSGGDADFDSVFLVVAEPGYPAGYRTESDDYLGINKYLYNFRLTNEQVSNNYIGGAPNSIAKYLGPSSSFRAEVSSDTFLVSGAGTTTIIFDNETTLSADYDNTTGEYTLPDSGVYVFTLQVLLKNNSVVFADTTIVGEVYARHYDSTGTIVLNESLVTTIRRQDTFNFILIPFAGFGFADGTTGDIVRVEVDTIGVSNLDVRATSYFSGGEANNLSGEFSVYDPDYFRSILYQFTPQEGTSYSDFKAIVNAPRDYTTFNGLKAWTKNVTFRLKTGAIDYELITDLITNQ